MARGLPIRRQLDHLVGAPIIWTLSRFRRRSPVPARPKKILVLVGPAIGDLVLLSGPLGDLRRTFPKSELVLFLSPENRQVSELIPVAHAVECVSLTNPWRALQRLWAHQADIVIDCLAWPRLSAMLSMASHGSFTVGFASEGQHRHFGYDIAVPHRSNVHELDNYRALIGALSSSPSSAGPTLRPPDRAAPHAIPGPYVILHAWASGSGKVLKEWPVEHWCAVVERLNSMGYASVLTGSPGDAAATRALHEAIQAHCPEAAVINLAGRCTLSDVATVIRGAAGTISVNTGLMHMSAALGTPTIALNGPTRADRWGAVGDRCASLTPSEGRFGYLNFGYEFGKADEVCMDKLAPEAVMKAFEALAATVPEHHPVRGLAAAR